MNTLQCIGPKFHLFINTCAARAKQNGEDGTIAV